MFLVLVVVYLFRFYAVRHSFREGDRVRVEGRLSEETVLVGGRQKLVVGGIRAYTERFPEYHYGDVVVVEGEVARLRPSAGSGLWRGEGGWYLREARVNRVQFESRLKILGVILSFRERLLAVYRSYLPEPHASLVAGMVLGTKSGLDFGIFEALRKTGTLHIVVASGSNIALVGGSVLGLLSYVLGRRKAVWVALVVIWLYVALAGFEPPLARAAFMGSIAFLGLFLGREIDSWRLLFLACFLLLLMRPLWLFDIGFQLSFLATSGILLFAKRIERFLGWMPGIFRGYLSMSLGAQVAVSPLLFYLFGQFSLISPVANIFVLPVVPFIMAGGALMALGGVVWEPLGRVVGWFVWLGVEYFVQVVKFFANL